MADCGPLRSGVRGDTRVESDYTINCGSEYVIGH